MLIIYAHPNKDGHNGLILKRLEEELDRKKTSYQVLDLYKMGFDPVMKPGEHYTSGHKNISEEVKRIQNLIKNERKFIFIYPTWWGSPPAILKGFLDRVFTSGFAFKYVKNFLGIFRPVSLLGGRAAVITTTGGPAIYEKTIGGDRALRVVTWDTLFFCGIRARGYMIGRALKLTDKNKKLVDRQVGKALKYLA